MPDLWISDFIDKIVYLEESVGHRTKYQTLAPFSANAKSLDNVQVAARHIAEFLGLGHLTFIITFVKQKEGIGGHIELQNDSTTVNVEIAPEVREFPDALLATLSHELTHKYLHTHRLYKSYLPSAQLENEILTDIAAVYLGLGKLMLNGCEVTKTDTRFQLNGYETTTATYRSGYLDRNQLAIAYRLICSMRGMPKSAYEERLNGDARLAIGTGVKQFRDLFEAIPPDTFTPSRQNFCSPSLDELELQLEYIDQILDKYTRLAVKKGRNQIDALKARSELDLSNVYNPAMRYLFTVRAEMASSKAQEALADLNRLMSKHLRYVDSLSEALNKFSKKEFPEFPMRPEGPKIGVVSKIFRRNL